MKIFILMLLTVSFLLLRTCVSHAQTPLPPVTITVQPGQQQPINVIAASPSPSPTPVPTPSPVPSPVSMQAAVTDSGQLAATCANANTANAWVNISVDGKNPPQYSSSGPSGAYVFPSTPGTHSFTCTGYHWNNGAVLDGSASTSVNIAAPSPSPTSTPVAGELRPDNTTANNTVPSAAWMAAYKSADANGADCTSGICAMSAQYAQGVDASFTGTTTQILQHYAAKYGIDPIMVMADAQQETAWHQNGIGDQTNGISLGILQIKSRDYPETCPTVAKTQNLNDVNASDCMSHLSTPFAVDYRMAWWASCLNGGAAAYFAAKGRDHSGEGYAAAVKNQDATLQSGCLGAWFSGSFGDTNGQKYVALVQQAAQQQPWTQPAFLKQPMKGLHRPRQ